MVNPHTKIIKEYAVSTDKTDDLLFVKCKSRDMRSLWVERYCNEYANKTLINKVDIIITKPNMMILVDLEKEEIEVWRTLKQELYDYMHQTDLGTTINHVIIEMMYSRNDRTFVYDESLNTEELVTFKFKDTKVNYKLERFYSWGSEYLNAILSNLDDAEECTVFENITHLEFKNLTHPVWRTSEIHILEILVFLGGNILFEKAKNLYYNLKKHSNLPIKLNLEMFL